MSHDHAIALRIVHIGRGARTPVGRLCGVIPGRSPTKGRLLVATPPLDDPNFDRTVIYVLEHHDEGALGVVINRPTEEDLGEPLDRWEDLQASPAARVRRRPGRDRRVDRAGARQRAASTRPSDDLSPVVRPGRLGRPDGRSGVRRRPRQRRARVPWLRRVGPGPARGRDHGRRLAGVRRRARRRVRRRSRTSCGARCCAARAAASAGSPTPPTTSARTELAQHSQRHVGLFGGHEQVVVVISGDHVARHARLGERRRRSPL